MAQENLLSVVPGNSSSAGNDFSVPKCISAPPHLALCFPGEWLFVQKCCFGGSFVLAISGLGQWRPRGPLHFPTCYLLLDNHAWPRTGRGEDRDWAVALIQHSCPVTFSISISTGFSDEKQVTKEIQNVSVSVCKFTL